MELQNKTLGEIVTADFRTSRVFQQFGIDFCCGGKVNFNEACVKAGLDPENVEKEILSVTGPKPEVDYDTLSPSALIAFILEEHHEYVRSESLPLKALAEKVSRVHGDSHPELAEVASIVDFIMADMDNHQAKEERILFPFIDAMEQSILSGSEVPTGCFGDVQNPIRMMEHEHDQVGALLFRLQELTENYTLPEDACQSYAMLYKRLEAFQNNTFRHVHLENNILFRKAIAMQSSL